MLEEAMERLYEAERNHDRELGAVLARMERWREGFLCMVCDRRPRIHLEPAAYDRLVSGTGLQDDPAVENDAAVFVRGRYKESQMPLTVVLASGYWDGYELADERLLARAGVGERRVG